jgi:hypothetical protein
MGCEESKNKNAFDKKENFEFDSVRLEEIKRKYNIDFSENIKDEDQNNFNTTHTFNRGNNDITKVSTKKNHSFINDISHINKNVTI